MRALLIFVVAAAFVILECQSLECHHCGFPASCLKKGKGGTVEVTCKAGEVCQRIQKKAFQPSDQPERGDEFGTIGGAIMERTCNSKAKCEMKKRLTIFTTTCCTTDLCNK